MSAFVLLMLQSVLPVSAKTKSYGMGSTISIPMNEAIQTGVTSKSENR